MSTETRLLFDSASSSASFGVRAGVAEGRSLVFRGGEYTLDIAIHSGRDRWGYHYGQLIRHADGSPVAGAGIGLDDAEIVRTDECGQFAVASEDAGAVRRVRVRTESGEITFDIPALSYRDDY